jgi:hypothetical protein
MIVGYTKNVRTVSTSIVFSNLQDYWEEYSRRPAMLVATFEAVPDIMVIIVCSLEPYN